MSAHEPDRPNPYQAPAEIDYPGTNEAAPERDLVKKFREQIHALSMKTLTPAEWAAENQRSQHHHH